MSDLLDLFVPGIPVPQGSKTPWGTEANPNTRPWRATVMWYARQAWTGKAPLDCPLEIHLYFVFPRLKSHFGSGKNSGVLSAKAPLYLSTKPDPDKLMRAILDALKDAGVVRDDSRFCRWSGTKKYGDSPGVQIIVRKIEEKS